MWCYHILHFTECNNTFVQVIYRETNSESIISCVFLNQSDTSEKTCCITLRLCDQEGLDNARQECNKTSSYDVQLEVTGRSNEKYCYSVTARNDTFATKVEGIIVIAGIAIIIIVPCRSKESKMQLSPGFDPTGNINTAVIVISIVIPCICIFLILGMVMIIMIIIVSLKRRQHLDKKGWFTARQWTILNFMQQHRYTNARKSTAK